MESANANPNKTKVDEKKRKEMSPMYTARKSNTRFGTTVVSGWDDFDRGSPHHCTSKVPGSRAVGRQKMSLTSHYPFEPIKFSCWSSDDKTRVPSL